LGIPFIFFRQNTRKQTFLRNLLTITRIGEAVNGYRSSPDRIKKIEKREKMTVQLDIDALHHGTE